jgi:hypothetical protein
VAKVLSPIAIAGFSYRVLRLKGARGPRYLLRNDAGDLIGLFPRGAEPMRLYAAPLWRRVANRIRWLASTSTTQTERYRSPMLPAAEN